MSEAPTYRTLIVDDETLARELMAAHLAKIPQLEVVGSCGSAIEALQVLQNDRVDVLFLDIRMPDLTGTELLKALPNAPLVVFTTAYSEYAIEGFNLNVVDYLLKPITFERFFQAVSKLLERLQSSDQPPMAEQSAEAPESTADALFVKADYKLVKVPFDDILFIEGMQKYVRFKLADQRVTSLMSLTKLEEILPPTRFFRVHKSYIVALDKIESVSGNRLLLSEGQEIPVSKTIRPELIKRLDQFGLLGS